MHITLYPEMDAKIKELLRIGDDPYCWYAAARIQQLEKELEQLKESADRLSKVNQLLPVTLEDASADSNRPIWIHLIKGWKSKKGKEYYGIEWVAYLDESNDATRNIEDYKPHSGLLEE